jgi:AcrR family transcriptional regulator
VAMWKAMATSYDDQETPQLAPRANRRSGDAGNNRRDQNGLAAGARAVVLEAAATLFEREGFDSVNLERLALLAGVSRSRIRRMFGPRDAFLQAYAEWLCEQERANWREAGRRSGDDPVQHVRELFIDVAAAMLSDGYRGGQLQRLAAQFSDDAHPVNLVLTSHAFALRDLLMRLAMSANVTDAEAFADTLMMLWTGAARVFEASIDPRRFAQRLSTSVNRVMEAYVRNA